MLMETILYILGPLVQISLLFCTDLSPLAQISLLFSTDLSHFAQISPIY